MSDESSKTMMVDERQTVRQVLDSLLDKSHCGYSPDWSLVETITELQMGECLDTVLKVIDMLYSMYWSRSRLRLRKNEMLLRWREYKA